MDAHRRTIAAAIITTLAAYSTGAHAIANTGDNRIGILRKDEPLPEPHVSEKSVFLPLGHIRQEKNLCVPTSAAMILKSYSDEHTPRELKTLSRGRDYDQNAEFSDFTVTRFKDFVSGMRRLGYTWRESNYMNNTWGYRSGMSDIKASLKRRVPVLVDTTLFGGHTLPVIGFDEDLDAVYLIDPNIAAPGYRVLALAQFEEIWNSRLAGYEGRAAIIALPK
jgi:hypothetical protein